MTKPFRIAPWVIPEDLQSIYDYHRAFSETKAERIVGEYDHVISLLEMNPLLLRERENGWRVYAFASGTYLLYYRELPSAWVVFGLFHARRDPDWISARLSERLSTRSSQP